MITMDFLDFFRDDFEHNGIKSIPAHWVFHACHVCNVAQDQPCVLKSGTKRVRRQGIAFLVHEARTFELVTE